jgi:hypothetical protein
VTDLVVRAVDALWTAVAFIGVAVSIWAYTDTRASLRAARAGNGERIVLARTLVRSALASFLLHAFFLLLGALAFLAPPTRPGFGWPGYLLLAGGYIAVAATNVRAVGLNQLERLRLRDPG